MIIGHLLTQNGLPDILRAIESLYPIVDETWVVDGGSTDGTWEFLQERADIYRLKLYQRPFIGMRDQRQFLLDLTPSGNWIVTIDQDESFSPALKNSLRNIILSAQIPQERQFPFVVKIPCFTLINDINHYSKNDYIETGSRVFYVDRDLKWYKEYHCEPRYSDNLEQEGRVDGLMINDLKQCIFHFAWLDPKRMRARATAGYQNYSPTEWDITKKEILPLPEGVTI